MLVHIVNNLKKENEGYHYYEESLACGSSGVFEKPPLLQKCLDLSLDCSLPLSQIHFKKNQSIMAMLFIQGKTYNVFSNSNNYEVYLNNEKIRIRSFTEIVELWYEIKPLILKNNLIVVKHQSLEDYDYFLRTRVSPVYKNKYIQKTEALVAYKVKALHKKK